MIEIIYKDKNIIAVNKPSGMVVFQEGNSRKESKSVSLFLKKEFPEIEGLGEERSGAVHRLDKDTSGVVLFARNEKTLSFLQEQLLEKKAKKRYITLVFKPLKRESGEIRTFIERSPKDRRRQRAVKESDGKREAVTFFKVIESFTDFSLLDVEIETGRKHQIRCHLSSIGHPVAGDRLYRFKDQKDPLLLKRQFLHAKSIEIETPEGKKFFEAPLSKDLEDVINLLRKENKTS